MGQHLLRDMLKQNKDYDDIIKNRSFGQGNIASTNTVLNDDQIIIKDIKEKINQIFKERILTESKNDNFKIQMKNAIEQLLSQSEYQGDLARRKALTQKILDDILGFGPIQNLIEDPAVTEIMVTHWSRIYIEKNGKLILVPEIVFNDDNHLRDVIDKIVQPIGRRIDESEPLVDARLPDGSRVNATIPPISPDGCTLTIRKFSKNKLTGQDYLNRGSLDEKMVKFLELAVIARCNIIVSGGTGSGKTTLLNMLSNYIPSWESIVTVEDSCELILCQDNVRRLEARPASAEGTGEVSIRRLVKNCLRMRPDRIVVGEIRDGCLVDMFRAMSSGHDGSLTTIHANTPRDLIDAAIPILFGMSDMKFTETAQKQLVCSAVDLIVQIGRLKDGSRKILNITHVVGFGKAGASKLKLKTHEEEKVYLQDIFKFKQTGLDASGKVLGRFEACNYIPKDIIERLESSGIQVPFEIFKNDEISDNTMIM